MKISINKSENYLPDPNSFSGRTQEPQSQLSSISRRKESSRHSISSLKSVYDLASKRPLNSQNINIQMPKLQSSIKHFKQHIIDHYTEKSHRRLKRFESNGILPYQANILRKNSILEVEINKKFNQYKKDLFIQKCMHEKQPNIKSKTERHGLGINVLEKLKCEITRKKARFFVPSNEKLEDESEEEQKDLKKFADYVKWLNKDGKKQYEALPIL